MLVIAQISRNRGGVSQSQHVQSVLPRITPLATATLGTDPSADHREREGEATALDADRISTSRQITDLDANAACQKRPRSIKGQLGDSNRRNIGIPGHSIVACRHKHPYGRTQPRHSPQLLHAPNVIQHDQAVAAFQKSLKDDLANLHVATELSIATGSRQGQAVAAPVQQWRHDRT